MDPFQYLKKGNRESLNPSRTSSFSAKTAGDSLGTSPAELRHQINLAGAAMFPLQSLTQQSSCTLYRIGIHAGSAITHHCSDGNP